METTNVTVRRRLTKKERRNRRIAKLLWNAISFIALLFGMIVAGVIDALCCEALAARLDWSEAQFFGFMIVGGLIGVIIVGLLSYPAKKSFYDFLCWIEEKTKKD